MGIFKLDSFDTLSKLTKQVSWKFFIKCFCFLLTLVKVSSIKDQGQCADEHGKYEINLAIKFVRPMLTFCHAR